MFRRAGLGAALRTRAMPIMAPKTVTSNTATATAPSTRLTSGGPATLREKLTIPAPTPAHPSEAMKSRAAPSTRSSKATGSGKTAPSTSAIRALGGTKAAPSGGRTCYLRTATWCFTCFPLKSLLGDGARRPIPLGSGGSERAIMLRRLLMMVWAGLFTQFLTPAPLLRADLTSGLVARYQLDGNAIDAWAGH